MPEKPYQEKTEPASPKRRQDARKKGQVGKSREVTSLAVLAAGVAFLIFNAKDMTYQLGGLIQKSFVAIPAARALTFNPMESLKQFFDFYFGLIGPIMLLLTLVAILANYIQVGVIWSVEPLAPKVSKINPIEGARRIFSKRSLVELAKSIAKIVIVGWAAFSILQSEFRRLCQLVYQEKVQILNYLGETAMDVMLRSCCVIAILAFLDYLYQKWEFEQGLKMTKQEVREEHKQTEGDPIVKARIRSIQREMARRRMMEDVKRADVVVTNPTHLSVALLYEPAEMKAPKVVGKGSDYLALKIRQIAKAHEVPLVENKTLAQNLYKSVDIGQEIPAELYKVVAEILAYIYRLKKSLH
jgi:flagellar biosynthetic protein FlhB